MGNESDPAHNLSDRQVDALREAGNIGAGNAAIALSQMVEERIGLSMPRASVLPLSQIPDLVGGAEAPVAGVYLRIEGDVSGSGNGRARRGKISCSPLFFRRTRFPGICLFFR